MSVGRICVLIAGLTGIAVAVVHFRAEQMGSAGRVLKLESTWMDLRRDWWSLQSRTARLRAPQRIHARLAGLEMDLLPPGTEPAKRSPVRLASRQP